LSEQICIRVKQIVQTIKIKHLYVSNKLYELSEQIFVRVEQFLQTTRAKHLYTTE
jgi:hypothetical protein